jgi:hypothetical protein
VSRPPVLAADGDRGDAGILQCLDVLQELVPRSRWSVDAGLGEENLVVPEAHHAEVEGNGIQSTVHLEQAHGAGAEVADPAGDLATDVADQAGFHLVGQVTAAP